MMRRFALSLIAVSSLVASTDVHAESLAEWDQAKVTALAEELATSADAIRRALRREPPANSAVAGRRAFWALREEMQVLVSASGRLHRSLAAGAGREETFPTYQRLMATARRAHREVRNVGLGEPVASKIDAAADVLRKIRPFYEPEPPL